MEFGVRFHELGEREVGRLRRSAFSGAFIIWKRREEEGLGTYVYCKGDSVGKYFPRDIGVFVFGHLLGMMRCQKLGVRMEVIYCSNKEYV